MYFLTSATKSVKGFEVGGASMMPRYRIATYFFDVEYPSGTDFLLGLGVLTCSQFAVFVGCAAGFASSESDRTIASLFVSKKSTLAFLVFLCFCFFVVSVVVSVDMSLSWSCSAIGLSGRGGSFVASGVIAIISFEMGFGAGDAMALAASASGGCEG